MIIPMENDENSLASLILDIDTSSLLSSICLGQRNKEKISLKIDHHMKIKADEYLSWLNKVIFKVNIIEEVFDMNDFMGFVRFENVIVKILKI